MTTPLKATKLGLTSHFEVRLVLVGAIVHLASRTEPVPMLDDAGRLVGVTTDTITDPAYGDTLGYIDWSAVTAVSWRWSE